MEEIGQAVQDLQKDKGINIEQLQSNDEFIDTLLQATQIAFRNSREEKLKALRNAVINTALPQPLDQTLRQMFLSRIDIFTVWHLRLLKLFHDPQEWAKTNNRPLPTNITAGGQSIVFRSCVSRLSCRPRFAFPILERPVSKRISQYKY